MMRSSGRSSVLVALILSLAGAPLAGSLAGCGASQSAPRSAHDVDDARFAEVRRRYLELDAADPQRLEVRAGLLAHLRTRSDAVLRGGDYDAIVAHLGQMTVLLAPRDFADGALPGELTPLAEHVALHGARRGDEPRVLAAELLLAALDREHAAEHLAEYERVSGWGREARAPAADEVMSIVEGGMGLVAVWEEHARLTPAPEVLTRLAALYLGLRDAIRGSSVADGFRPPRSLGDMRHLEMAAMIMQRAPLEAAAVFLVQGDLEGAIAQLEDRGAQREERGPRERGGDIARLRRVLEDARTHDSHGADALSQIANGYGEARPEVALGLCRLGLRRFAEDARFPLCLARASSSRGAVGDTADYYSLTLRLDPHDLEVHDEALETFASMISQGALNGADVGEVRTAGRVAHEIVALRATRFPNADPAPLDQPTLHLALARAELQSGHAEQARGEFEAAIAEARRLSATPAAAIEARRELALLELRSGEPAAARVTLEEALGLVSQGRSGDETRARLEAVVGDTFRRQDDTSAATTRYRAALRLLEGLEDARAESAASRAILRGTLLRRVGEHEASRRSFEEAITLAPSPENAASILQQLVVETPDPELAELVFRRARVGSPIGHARKVYLALWVEAVRVMASAPPSEEGTRVLSAEAARGGWQARLAGLARGELDEQAALAAAEGGSERCEAHFYAAIRALRVGDRATAARALEASVQTGMLGRPEYAVAQELSRVVR